MTIQEIISKIGKGQKGSRHLTAEEAAFTMKSLLEGKASPYQVGAILISLRVKEESSEELVEFTRTAMEMIHPDLAGLTPPPGNTLDLPFYAGKKSSFHVGIPASFIMAGAGLQVVLHGDPNPPGRTSKSAVLNSLGWKSGMPLRDRVDHFRDSGWTYFDVSQIHPGVKQFLDLRSEIGLRSVFHTIARFLNPLKASSQVVGVSHPKSFDKIGDAMRSLKISQGLVIRGLEGESEAGLSGPVEALRVTATGVSRIHLDPGLLGLAAVTRTAIELKMVSEEAQNVIRILDGSLTGDPRRLSLWNAAIGLYVSGVAPSLERGLAQATDSLETGKALKVFNQAIYH